jgi:transcriptional regulator with XRE-family HTH domain
MKTLGETIREKRIEKGWSQEELAKKANVTVSAISSIEKGKNLPSLFLAAKIALALEINLQSFLEKLIEERGRRPGKNKPKTRITNICLLMLPKIAATGVKTLKEFAQRKGYRYTLVLKWVHGYYTPSVASCKRLSKDLEIDLEELKKVAEKDRKMMKKSKGGRLPGQRKRSDYPTNVAMLVHQARKELGLSLLDLASLRGIPRPNNMGVRKYCSPCVGHWAEKTSF